MNTNSTTTPSIIDLAGELAAAGRIIDVARLDAAIAAEQLRDAQRRRELALMPYRR